MQPPIELNPWRIALQWIAGFVVLFVAIGVTLAFFEAESVAAAKEFVRVARGPGVALGFFVPDSAPLPVPHDLFSAAGLVGGMSFSSVVAWAWAGSMAGGSVGFLIGRRLSHTAWFAHVMANRGAQAAEAVRRWGALGVAVGALTPIPYALSAWAAGALGMSYARFMLVSQLRIPRIIAYLWAIEHGVLSTLETLSR